MHEKLSFLHFFFNSVLQDRTRLTREQSLIALNYECVLRLVIRFSEFSIRGVPHMDTNHHRQFWQDATLRHSIAMLEETHDGLRFHARLLSALERFERDIRASGGLTNL